MREITDHPHVFCDALLAARKSQPYGRLVNAHTPDDLTSNGVRLFISDDNLAGCAVEPNGNITAVFKNRMKAGAQVPDELMLTALSHGGCKLDCYGGNLRDEAAEDINRVGYLPPLYMSYGFIPVARVDFDPRFAEDGFEEQYGPRDIIIFHHNGDTIDRVVSRIRRYSQFELSGYLALPVMSYDDAIRYRDKIFECNDAIY